MKPETRQALGMLLVIPASIAMAAIVFGGMLGIITLGWYVAHGIYWFFRGLLNLPKAVSLGLTVIPSALSVYVIVVIGGGKVIAGIEHAADWIRTRKT